MTLSQLLLLKSMFAFQLCVLILFCIPRFQTRFKSTVALFTLKSSFVKLVLCTRALGRCKSSSSVSVCLFGH